jgi:hypothetical protein
MIREDQVYNDDEGNGVFEITLKSGEKIALDLTGAQYNAQHQTVMHWENYWTNYGEEILERNIFGTALQNHNLLLSQFDKFSELTIIAHVLDKFNVRISASSITLPSIARETSQHRFHTQLNTYIHFTINYLADCIQELDADKAHTTTIVRSMPHGLFHPRVAEKSIYFHHGRMLLLPDYGPNIANFHWEIIKDLAKDPKTPYKVRKEARDLLSYRCLVSPFGDQRILFMRNTLPRESMPKEWVKVNPFWDASRVLP